MQSRCPHPRRAPNPLRHRSQALRQHHRPTGSGDRPVIAQIFRHFLYSAPCQTIERLEEEQHLDRPGEHEPLRITPHEVGELVGEHAVLLLGLELEQRAPRQAHLVAGERNRTRECRRAGELHASVYASAREQLAQALADRRSMERGARPQRPQRSRVA
jgi:hypothetical protein